MRSVGPKAAAGSFPLPGFLMGRVFTGACCTPAAAPCTAGFTPAIPQPNSKCLESLTNTQGWLLAAEGGSATPKFSSWQLKEEVALEPLHG